MRKGLISIMCAGNVAARLVRKGPPRRLLNVGRARVVPRRQGSGFHRISAEGFTVSMEETTMRDEVGGASGATRWAARRVRLPLLLVMSSGALGISACQRDEVEHFRVAKAPQAPPGVVAAAAPQAPPG